MAATKRNYKREAAYEDSPVQVKHREMRNAARRQMVKAGKAAKGDGRDVGHLLALGRGGSNNPRNFQMQSVAANRSFARKADGTMASETSRREQRKKR